MFVVPDDNDAIDAAKMPIDESVSIDAGTLSIDEGRLVATEAMDSAAKVMLDGPWCLNPVPSGWRCAADSAHRPEPCRVVRHGCLPGG